MPSLDEEILDVPGAGDDGRPVGRVPMGCMSRPVAPAVVGRGQCEADLVVEQVRRGVELDVQGAPQRGAHGAAVGGRRGSRSCRGLDAPEPAVGIADGHLLGAPVRGIERRDHLDDRARPRTPRRRGPGTRCASRSGGPRAPRRRTRTGRRRCGAGPSCGRCRTRARSRVPGRTWPSSPSCGSRGTRPRCRRSSSSVVMSRSSAGVPVQVLLQRRGDDRRERLLRVDGVVLHPLHELYREVHVELLDLSGHTSMLVP